MCSICHQLWQIMNGTAFYLVGNGAGGAYVFILCNIRRLYTNFFRFPNPVLRRAVTQMRATDIQISCNLNMALPSADARIQWTRHIYPSLWPFRFTLAGSREIEPFFLVNRKSCIHLIMCTLLAISIASICLSFFGELYVFVSALVPVRCVLNKFPLIFDGNISIFLFVKWKIQLDRSSFYSRDSGSMEMSLGKSTSIVTR